MTKSKKHKVEKAVLGDFHFSGDDAVLPFEVAGLDIRGRSVQLGEAIDTILARQDYPEPVSRLLAEVMALTVLLGSSLKFEGKFIVQTSSDGPVNLLVCDFQTPNFIRGYARFDKEALDSYVEKKRISPEDLLGKGTLALTVDQGNHMQRYQGIVALDGTNLEEIARNYFLQSEQIPTEVRLAVATLFYRDDKGETKRSWRAGGLLVQYLPQSEFKAAAETAAQTDEGANDHWEEVKALMATVDSAELTDPQVGSEKLLYRLFHQHGARVFNPTQIIDQCSCSREKIEAILQDFTAEELQQTIVDGEIQVRCEFCSRLYQFNPDEFKKR